MKEKIEKTFWVSGTSLSEIDGQTYIPTAICFESDQSISFGQSAISQSSSKYINRNFKVDLGDISPGVVDRKLFITESGKEKSAYELSKIFFDEALKGFEKGIVSDSATNKIGAKIMVAEPLGFQVDGRHKNWIGNYRENIRRILNRYEEVEFLPEPFAVYQYYRYGLRIPQLKDNAKHVALIIDFGGGTFDVCVIESNQQGDISQSGKHSKPLAADSIPVGGFVINAVIAEYLIKKGLEGAAKSRADQHIDKYRRVNKGELKIGDINAEAQIFIRNLIRLENDVENYKVELVNKIRNWDLKADAYEKVGIKIPHDPFLDGNWIDSELYAHQLRDIFVNGVWDKSIKAIVRRMLDRAKDALGRKEIGITLISGGSSNIRWITNLLMRDFSDELFHAKPISINDSFQEIVAKGLAIECARRFYDESSEFISVTYNPVKLFLDPDDKGIEKRRFRSVEDKIDMKDALEGDLIPAAQALQHFVDIPLRWKVKLSHPPKHDLKYYFSRPGSETHFDCYNTESTVVYTKNNKNFDSNIVVEITVKEDGTVLPRFIYKSGNDGVGIEENAESGIPFAIDMTTGIDSIAASSQYIGFDFGTSSSSICQINKTEIQIAHNRQYSAEWTGLSDSLRYLPYPVSVVLRKYLDVKNSDNACSYAREVFESCLAFMAYCSASELVLNNKLGKQFKSFPHRSMGPLKSLLDNCFDALGDNCFFSKPFKKYVIKNGKYFNSAISDFNDHKHDKKDSSLFDYHSYVVMAVEAVLEGMSGRKFGYGVSCDPVPFRAGSYRGLFKVAHDVQPFTETLPYSSNYLLAKEFALLVDSESGKAMNLMPLIFWYEKSNGSISHCCYLLDKLESANGVLVKPCDQRDVVQAGSINHELDGYIASIKSSDFSCDPRWSEVVISLELDS